MSSYFFISSAKYVLFLLDGLLDLALLVNTTAQAESLLNGLEQV